jgi:hypothetical protein
LRKEIRADLPQFPQFQAQKEISFRLNAFGTVVALLIFRQRREPAAFRFRARTAQRIAGILGSTKHDLERNTDKVMEAP